MSIFVQSVNSMSLKLLNVRAITDSRLIKYIEEDRGISKEVYLPLLNEYEVLVKPYGSPHAKKAIYCGMPNYTNDGAFLSNWFDKTGSRFLDNKNPIILNYYTPKCLLFSSMWDMLSYLNLNINVHTKIKKVTCLIIIESGTKKAFEDLQLQKFKKVGACFRKNDSGDLYTRNFLKVFPNGIDLRDKDLIGNAKSLNDVLRGKI